MKKRILFVGIVLLFACLTLGACFGFGNSNSGSTNTQTTTQTYEVVLYGIDGTTTYHTNDFVTSSGTYTKPKIDPEKEGYTFEGWYLDEDKTTPLVVGEKIKGATVHIYAKWEKAKVQVLVEDKVNGNSVFKIEYGTKFQPADPAKPEGYTFGGYYTDAGRTRLFDKNTLVKSELTLYVKWESEENDIVYELNGGTLVVDNAPTKYLSGATVVLPNAKKTGYTFAGWYDNQQFTGEIITKIEDTYGDKTVYAKYICDLATMEAKVGSSTKTGARSFEFGTDHTAHNVNVKDYFTFAENAVVKVYEGGKEKANGVVTLTANNKTDGTVVHWNYTVSVTSESGKTSEDYTVVVNQYDKSTVSVRYYVGEDLVSTDSVNVGAAITKKISNPDTKAGYTFAFWSKDGTHEYVFGQIALAGEDVTLTAVYETISYTVTYSLGTATNHANNPDEYNIESSVALSNPTVRPGYTFVGWYKDAAYTQSITTLGGTTGNLTLYARYTKEYHWDFAYDGTKYTVTLDEYPYLLDYLAFNRIESATAYFESGYSEMDESFLKTSKGEVNVGYGLNISSTIVGDEVTAELTFEYSSEAEPVKKSETGTYEQIAFVPMVTGATMPSGYNDFAVEHIAQSISVRTGEQLFYALEKGYRPVCALDSTAESLYIEMKDVLRAITDMDMSEKEICVAIAQYLVRHIAYDNDTLKKYEEGVDELSNYRCFYLEGAIKDGVAVCDGISKAFVCMARIMGIEAYQVKGKMGTVNHAWNKVNIDLDGNGTREWTAIDCTAANMSIESKSIELMNYTYLFVTDDFLTKEHGYEYDDKWDSLYVTETPYNIYDGFEYKTGKTYKVTTQSELNAIMVYYKQQFDDKASGALSFSIYMPKSLGLSGSMISSNLPEATRNAGFTEQQYNRQTTWSSTEIGTSDVVITFYVTR